jgi:hypothetical protein
MIPARRHNAVTKKARKTKHRERFNKTWRRRISRSARETLACPQKLANHLGAIRLFVCHDMLTKAPQQDFYNTASVKTEHGRGRQRCPRGMLT